MTDEDGELNFARVFGAPRELVFRCMVEPEHLTHFWGPIGVSTPLEKILVDARPGGAFETVMVNEVDGSEYVMRAVFDEVVEPDRLVWTDLSTGMMTTATFSDFGDSVTEVRIRQTKVSQFLRSPESQAGFLSSLDRFAAYLEKFTEGSPR
jgi:uncharacterized protein YndB with AHSA1/START domain